MHRKVPVFLLPGSTVSIQQATLLLFSGSALLLQMCGDNSRAFTQERHHSAILLDDLIVMAPYKERAVLQTMELVQHFSALGFVINWQKR